MLTFKKVYSDGMVLQRDTDNPVRGCAAPCKAVSVVLSRGEETVFTAEVTADEKGGWAVTLPPEKGGFDSFTLTASCGGETAKICDICFGEVFHISGQSNMELPMSRTFEPFRGEVKENDYPYIREFRTVIENCFDPASSPDDFAGGCWKKAVGSDILSMSAAGFYFAEDIFKRLDMPVGLVNTSAGGAALESFMPYEMIKGYCIHDDFLKEATAPDYIAKTTEEDMKRSEEWHKALGSEDFGMKPDESMKSCFVPCSNAELEDCGEDFSGRIWFFKKFSLAENFPKKDALLMLGTITDSDCAFINGVKVGETAYLYPPRYYPIPEGVLKTGENILAVRMEISGGKGGFTKGKRYCIKSGNRTAELAGEWKYAVAKKCERLKPGVFFQGLPLALYSCMTAPVLPLKFRAMLWYQGETNCGRAYIYRKMFGDFAEYYRKNCGYEIPVIFVQLCNFGNEGDETSSWAKFRQAQLECLEIPDTAMAVTVDIGEYNDLHPTNKKEVGRRLAMRAGELLYGDEQVFVRCKKAVMLSDGRIWLVFDDCICLTDGDIADFEAVGEKGVIKCSAEQTAPCEIVLTPEGDCQPESVRYAYRNAPRAPFVLDRRMTPISPFTVKITAKTM